MWSRVTVKTKPALLPIPAAVLADRLRVDDAAEHGEIEGFLIEALAGIDGPDGIGVAVMAQVWTLTLDRLSPEIDLPGWPVTGVAEIRYLDADGAWQVIAPALYRVVPGVEPARLVLARGAAWPAIPAGRGVVQIDYTLGAEDPADAEAGLVSAAALIAGHLYEHRSAVQTGAEAREVPLGAAYALSRYRRCLVAG